MNKAQPIKFNSIDDFLKFLPEEELKIVSLLRRIVFDCIPNVKEKLSYNVPYYYKYSRICFIWPASVPWGNLSKGVALGFCRGNKLLDEFNYLKTDGRKQVYRHIFTTVKEIDTDILKAYLFEAIILDEQHKRKQ